MIEHWSVDKNGMPSKLSISSCEIPRALFAKFLNDDKYPEKQKPQEPESGFVLTDPSKPIVNLRQDDAIRFCNWLSVRHGLQECYKHKGTTKYTDFKKNEIEMPTWKLDPGASGYRLPASLEWELAARGGTQTSYSHSDSEFFVGCSRYQWHRTNSNCSYQPVAQLMPNQFGIFDMLGNAAEICWGTDGLDSTRSYKTIYSYWGGSALDNVVLHRIGIGRAQQLHRRNYGVGFRVVIDRNADPELDQRLKANCYLR